jgi:peptide/nickel transport system substrate-binding protein/microcin C transport system substrate-binding protein
MRNELFQDKKLRLALSHLFNREEMVKKFLSNMVYLANGPIYVQSEYNPGNKPIEFNPTLAKKLLAEAGWKDSNKDGVLDKMVNGKLRSLEFDLLYVSKDSEKYFTLFQQDLKNAGVKMNIRQLEWNALLKNVDEGKFDTVAMAWSASVDPDPKQIWHSASIGGGGSNHIAYSNPTVDKLIDEARLIPDRKQRIAKLKKVYQIIADDAPYIFMFNRKYSTYGHSARVNKPSDTFQYDIGTAYWWSGKSVQ